MKIRAAFSFDKDHIAQIYTLEALIAATIMIGVLIFTIQATSLTPLTSSTANAHVETHLYTIGQDILSSLDYPQNGEDSGLKKDILNWDGDSYSWNSVTYVHTNKTLTNSSTAEMLETVIVPRGIAHNVEFTWIDNNGNTIILPYIYNGEPSNNAVVVSKKLLLSDSDMQMYPDFTTTTGIGDMDTNTDFYSLINVRLTLWRM